MAHQQDEHPNKLTGTEHHSGDFDIYYHTFRYAGAYRNCQLKEEGVTNVDPDAGSKFSCMCFHFVLLVSDKNSFMNFI